jgi:hypothetical protein
MILWYLVTERPDKHKPREMTCEMSFPEACSGHDGQALALYLTTIDLKILLKIFCIR